MNTLTPHIYGVMLAFLSIPICHAEPYQFGSPVNLGSTVNSPGVDAASSLTANNLYLFFDSDRPGSSGGRDIWMSQRATSSSAWTTPTNLGLPVNSPVDEGEPEISADGLSLFFDSARIGGHGRMDIWFTSRTTLSSPWNTPANLGTEINTSAFDSGATITPDSLEMFFMSDRAGGIGHFDLWTSTRTTTGDVWNSPTNLGGVVNSSEWDSDPSISADGLNLFFTSLRDGDADLWMASRSTRLDAWGEPSNLGIPVNSTEGEASPFISHDGATLYFQSGRSGGIGGADLWEVSVVPEPSSLALIVLCALGTPVTRHR